MRKTPTGPSVRFVYDCPDFEEFDIFEHTAEGVAVASAEGLRNADEHNCMLKNMRGDRFTLLAIPEETLELPSLTNAQGPSAAAQSTLVEEQVSQLDWTGLDLTWTWIRA